MLPLLSAAAWRDALQACSMPMLWSTVMQGKLAPDLLAAIVQQANFERRQGQREAACSAFSSALEKHSKEPASDSYPFLVLQYAAFLLQAFADAAEARVVYSAALASHPGIRRLWEVGPPASCCND